MLIFVYWECMPCNMLSINDMKKPKIKILSTLLQFWGLKKQTKASSLKFGEF